MKSHPNHPIVPNHPILAVLKRARRRLVARRLFRFCVQGFALFGLLVVVSHLATWRGALREPAAALATGLFFALALGWIVVRWGLTLLRRPSTVDVAAAVETCQPGLMDSLICATELAERGGERNPIEAALLQDIRDKLSADAICRAALPRRLHVKRLAWEALAACLLLLVALRTEFLDKARYGLGLAGRGAAGRGLLVEPGDAQAPLGGDLRIAARVRRWEAAAMIEVADESGVWRHPMNRADEAFHFTLYSLDGALRYRVLTPSLASPWFAVDVFVPPRFEQLRCILEPPAYTRQAATVLDEWRDATMLAGTSLTIEVRTNVPCEVGLLEGDARTAFAPSPDGFARLSLPITEERQLSVGLRDGEGREHRTRVATFTVFPDTVPVVDIVQPAEDATVLPGEGFMLEARAVDDFALGEVVLHLSVGGRRELAYVLQDAPAVEAAGDVSSDVTVRQWVSLEEIGAEAGDVVAVYVTASDLRAPHPQTGRSDIRFVEVRPEIEPMEGASGQDVQTLDIMRLIAELRRLIRLNYDVMARSGERRDDLALQLAAGLSDLRVEIVAQMEQIEAEAPPGAREAVWDWYDQGLAEVEQARSFTRQADYPLALRAQERALSLFTKLAQELMKNQTSEASEDAQGGEGGAEGAPEEDAQRQRMTLAEAMRLLREAQADLRGLADRQATQNRRVAGSADATLEETLDLAGRQAELARGAERVGGGLEGGGLMQKLSDLVERAGNDMRQAESRLSEGDVPGGERSGLRAQRGLLEAADEADQLARQLASRQLADLAEQFGKLAELESKLADFTQSTAARDETPKKTRDALRDAQAKIAEKTTEMLTGGDRLAGDMEDMFPAAGRALAEAMQAARTRNPEAKMDRAANALLYGRMDRATDYQRQAAADLQMAAQEVQLAGDRLPKVSRNELLQAMAEAQRAAAEARSGGEGEASQALVERAASTLSRLGLQMNDMPLMQLAGNIGQVLDGDGTDASLPMAGRYFDQAVDILRRHLLRLEVEGREDLSRRMARPPEPYERLVEEYFKSLSEGQ